MTILSKQYPMDLGTGTIEQVNQSAAKIDNEFTAIYGHLNNIRVRYRSATAPSNPEAGQLWEDTVNNKVMKWTGSAWVEDIAKSVNLTNRNTVLQGQVSSVGALELILGSTSALTADLVSSAINTIIAIPAGHDDVMGNADYIVSFSATQTDFWTSLPANNTSYLFVDYSSGTVTGAYSVIAPIYQSYAPSHSSGKHWYDTNKEQWYLSNGSAWTAVYRCYVGSVVTDGTKVIATTIEPYNVIRSSVPMIYLDTDTTLAANSDSKIATQKAVKTYVDAKPSGGGAIGTGNYIAEPFAVTAGTGLQVLIDPNRCVIDETAVESTAQTAVALTAKAAQLVFKTKAGTYDKLLPKMTAADLVDTNTIALWFPDGSASVPNAAVGVNGNTLAVTNALTKSGTITAVDGWAGGDAAKGDGATGYYTSANGTNIPNGLAPIAELKYLFTYNGVTAGRQCLACIGGNNFQYFGLEITAAGNLQILYGGDIADTGFALELGRTYRAILQYNGSSIILSVDGRPVYSLAAAFNVYANFVSVFFATGANLFCKATLHCFGVSNALSTPAQIATDAQKLLIPCAYGATDIRSVLPADSIVTAYVETSSTAPTKIIDASTPSGAAPDWAYGIRVGPMGSGNKTKRLGRKSFSGTSTPEWDNPFGSRNITIDAEWSLQSAGTNSSPIPNEAANSYPSVLINGKIRETITTGVNVAGSNKTSGYIDIIAEVKD